MRRAEGATSSARRSSAPGAGRIVAWILLAAFLVVFAAGMVGLHAMRQRFLPLDFRASSSAGPETWAIIGLDDRQFADNPVDRDNTPGARADVILIVTERPDGLKVTSVSRDILVHNQGIDTDRLTMFWMRSPQSFVDATCRGLGIPVDHIVRFDFRSFQQAVDAVGGVDITSPYALRQLQGAGPQWWIDIPAGTTHLTGEQALRYVRVRHGEAFINGKWIREPDAPAKRQMRAAQVFSLVLAKARHRPQAMPGLVWRMAPDIGLDKNLAFYDLAPLSRVEASKVASLPADVKSDVIETPNEDTKRYVAGLGYTGCSI